MFRYSLSNLGSNSCGYFSDRISSTYGIFSQWIIEQNDESFPLRFLYDEMLENGLRRCGSLFYKQKCDGCSQCIPIRILVKDFKPSKSQRAVWRKNQDLEMRICGGKLLWQEVDPEIFSFSSFSPMTVPNFESDERADSIKKFITDEKVILFRQYSSKIHGRKMSFEDAKNELLQMHLGYTGVFDMEYYENDRLVAVGIIDFSEREDGSVNSLSSNYFYYDSGDSSLKRSLGVFSVLKEIELCREIGANYYYLGLYLHDCKKMNYKINYKPNQLRINGRWIDGENALGGVAERPEQSEDLQQAPDGDERSRNAQMKNQENNDFLDRDLIYEIPIPKDDEFNDDICLVTKDIPLQLLYSAYMQGVFPWFNEDEQQPVMWFCPNPRFVLFPDEMHVSKSIKKFLKHTPYTYTMDLAFDRVIRECRKMKRSQQDGTWIGEKMIGAYTKFHEEGFAHSIEVWHDEKLVGGFYGVLIGRIFCGESMFTIEPNSSKSAFVLFAKAFEECGGFLIDCQCYTDNMARYGAVEISRDDFLNLERPLLFLPLEKNLKDCFEKNCRNLNE